MSAPTRPVPRILTRRLPGRLAPPAPERDPWRVLAARTVRIGGGVLLAAFVVAALAGSPVGRRVLDTRGVNESIQLDAAVGASLLRPAWLPRFDEQPFWLAQPGTHVRTLGPVVSGFRTVFDPATDPDRWEVVLTESYADPATGERIAAADIAVGDRMQPLYHLESLTPETLRGLVVLDPVQGPVAVPRALEPFGVIQVEGQEMAVPPPARGHDLPATLLGTDRHARDLAARLAAGAWYALQIGLGAAVVAVALGVAGAFAVARLGVRSGWVVGHAGAVLVTFPVLLLAAVVLSLVGAEGWIVVLLLGAVAAPVVTGRARDTATEVRASPEAETARTLGAPEEAVHERLVRPRVIQEVIGTGLLVAGAGLLVETSLAFLGLAPPPPSLSLGSVVADAAATRPGVAWLVWLPGLALAAGTTGLLVTGESLRRRRVGADVGGGAA